MIAEVPEEPYYIVHYDIKYRMARTKERMESRKREHPVAK